jgi:hypothetical protein
MQRNPPLPRHTKAQSWHTQSQLVTYTAQARRTRLEAESVDLRLIGRACFAKAWYSNVRESIGTGKEVPVPPQLDWDLFRGPAPRQIYKDKLRPYNWHWLRTWGTGEIRESMPSPEIGESKT